MHSRTAEDGTTSVSFLVFAYSEVEVVQRLRSKMSLRRANAQLQQWNSTQAPIVFGSQ
jgi:hypothetical protein